LTTFICHYLVLFKTNKIASILNKILTVEKEMHVQYEGTAFKIIFCILFSIILTNMMISRIYNQNTVAFIIRHLIVELNIMSLIFSIILFTDLILSINKSLNCKLEKDRLNQEEVCKLRIIRGIMNEVAEDVQSLYGFPIFILIFDRSLFFVYEFDQVSNWILNFIYIKDNALAPISYMFAFWACLDAIVVLTLFIICARTESEVSSFDCFNETSSVFKIRL